MSKLNILVLFLLLFTVTGCATFYAMDWRDQEVVPNMYPAIYPGTIDDVALFNFCIHGGLMIGRGSDFLGVIGSGFASLLLLIDFPVSITTDTIFLPYDIYRITPFEKPSITAIVTTMGNQ